METSQATHSRLVRIAALTDLMPNEPSSFTVANEEILVVRTAGGVYAVNNKCTHAEAYLDMGFFHADTLEIECPLHVGRFDIRTGAATVEPCVIPVTGYRVVVEGSDVLVEYPSARDSRG